MDEKGDDIEKNDNICIYYIDADIEQNEYSWHNIQRNPIT